MIVAYLGINLFVASLSQAQSPSSATQDISIDGIGFKVPKPFRVEKVAGNDMTTWPIVATWDADGSLVVAESVWNRQKVTEQLISRPHRIIRLRDTDSDGRFDQRKVIAEKLSFPEGVLCIGGELLVTAPPQIWKLSDNDKDGFFETHEVWFDGKTLTGCANDLHGPWLGLDGWIYWSKSAFAEQSNTVRSGDTLTSKASHLYRRHPKGGPIESVMTGGMDNLVDIAMSSEGERFFCSTFLHHPRSGFRDGIGHAIYGSVFGKPHEVLNNHVKTGPLMAPIAELGPAAPAGLHYLQNTAPILDALRNSSEANQETNPVLLCAQFNLQKVSVHELIPLGATFTTTTLDLLTADKIDFHPVDVLEDNDGSLIVVDTGGWYDLCCPSSGTDQRIALGGIYRISTSTTRELFKAPTSAKTNSPEAYVADAGSKHPAVARNALKWLEENSEQAIAAIESVLHDPNASTEHQLALLWCMARVYTSNSNNQRAEGMVTRCLAHPNPRIQQAALHIASLNLWPSSKQHAIRLIDAQSPTLRRLAAECIGRFRDPSDVELLMRSISGTDNDRALEHAILFAIMEIKATNQLAQFVSSKDPSIRYAAIFCLNEMQASETLSAEVVTNAITDTNQRVQKIALEIMAKNPQWARSSIEMVSQLWSKNSESSLSILERLMGGWIGQPDIDVLIANWLSNAKDLSDGQRALLLNLIAKQKSSPLPREWVTPLGNWITNASRDDSIAIGEAMQNIRWDSENHSQLIRILLRKSESVIPSDPELALTLTRALPKGTSDLPEKTQRLIVNACSQSDSNIQKLAFDAISKIRLSSSAADALLPILPNLTPTQLPSAIECLLQSRIDSFDESLFAVLSKTPATKSLSQPMVMSWLKDRTPETQTRWKDFFESTNRPPENVHSEVEQWLAKLPTGDKTQGFHVFRGAKAACSGCHQVGYVGGNIGPELSRIGQTRTRHDLMEAILFPSVRLAQSYQATKILTEDGLVLNGLIASETATHVDLVLSADKRVTIAKEEIAKRELSDTSVMPAGLEKQLSLQELADLIAYLESAK